MISKVEALQAEHQQLLKRLESGDRAGLETAVGNYIERVRAEAAGMKDPLERDQLRGLLRFWAAFLLDKTGTYPDTTLAPLAVEMFVPDAALVSLWAEIDSMEQRVTQELDSKIAVSEHLDRLALARNLLLNSRENFEDARRQVAEVKADLNRRALTRRWATTYGPILILYNLLWLGLAGFGIFYAVPNIRAGTELVGVDARSLLLTVVFGVLGGIAGELNALARHVSRERDFDPQYLLWYLTGPIMGGLLGFLVYVLVRVSVTSISTGELNTNSVILYLLAFLVGLQQNLFFTFVNRFMQRLIPPPEDKNAIKKAERG